MLATLLESGTKSRQRPGTASLSLLLHVALIIGALALAPRRAPPIMITDFPQKLVYVDPVTRFRVQRQSSGPESGFPSLPLPEIVPVPDIYGVDPGPEIVISAVGSDATSDIRSANSAVGSGDPIVTGQGVYTLAAVEKPAVALPGNRAPLYPDILRSAGIEGSVLVQFVIDTTGMLEPGSVRILDSDHDLFTAAVRGILGVHRFLPAEVTGHKVRMLVQQRFDFAIEN